MRAKSIEFISGERKKTLRDNIPEQEMTRIWGGDRRLLLFSYSIETINMLIIPMIRTKYVKIKNQTNYSYYVTLLFSGYLTNTIF